MNHFYKYSAISVLLTAALVHLGQASPLIDTTSKINSYAHVLSYAKKHHLSGKNILWVFDNDDTLTMMPCANQKNCHYLGGPSWFNWQSHMIGKKNKGSIANSFFELLHDNTLIFTLTHGQLAEPKAESKLIHWLQQSKTPTMVATMRSGDMANATEYTFSKLHLITWLSNAAPQCEKKSSLAYPLMLANFKRPARYEQGVLYLSGQDKGIGVAALLKKCHDQPTTIVFLDDVQKNVLAMQQSFASKVNFIGFRYAYLDGHKKRFNMAEKQKSNRQWHTITESQLQSS